MPERVVTRTVNGTRGLELEEAVDGSGHTIIGMQMILQGQVASDRHGRNISGVGKIRL